MKLLSLVVAIAMVGCAGADGEETGATSEELRIANPVIESCYDGAPIRNGDDFYIVCAGGSSKGGYFPIYKSHDMVSFEKVGNAIAPGGAPAWANGIGSPEIHHVQSGGFAVVFSGNWTKTGKRAVGISFAAHIEGPYVDTMKRPLADAGSNSTIDAHVFTDGGQSYLFYKEEVAKGGKDADRILAAKLSDDATRLTSAPKVVLEESLAWEAGVVEAPWVWKRGDTYFMTYSGNHYCNGNYAVGVARAKSPFGPWEKFPKPILAKGSRWVGPGHQGIVRGPDGKDWIEYHAYKLSEGVPACDESKPDNDHRRGLVDRITYENGWPRVAANL